MCVLHSSNLKGEKCCLYKHSCNYFGEKLSLNDETLSLYNKRFYCFFAEMFFSIQVSEFILNVVTYCVIHGKVLTLRYLPLSITDMYLHVPSSNNQMRSNVNNGYNIT